MSVQVEYQGLDETSSEFEFFGSVTENDTIIYNGDLEIHGIDDGDGVTPITTFYPECFLFEDEDDTYELFLERDEAQGSSVATYKLELFKNGGTTAEDSAAGVIDPVITITHPTVESSGSNPVSNVTLSATDLDSVTLAGNELRVIARSDPDTVAGEIVNWDHQCILYATDLVSTADTNKTELSCDYTYIAQDTNYGISFRMYTDLGILYTVTRTLDTTGTGVEDLDPADAAEGAVFPSVTAQIAFFAREVSGTDSSYDPPFEADGVKTIPDPLVADSGTGEVGDTEFLKVTLGATDEDFTLGFSDATDIQEKKHSSDMYVTWTQEIDFTNVGEPVEPVEPPAP